MKKLSKLIALAVTLTVAAFTGCSNLVDDATIDNGVVIDGCKNLTIDVASDGNVVTFANSSSRLIAPDTLDGTTGYAFILWGTEKLGLASASATASSLQTPAVVTFTADTDSTTRGTVTLNNLQISAYDLNLAMIPTGDWTTISAGTVTPAKVIEKAVLLAKATADLRYSDTVSFYLTPNLLTSSGLIEVTLNSADTWKVPAGYIVTVGIYDLKTGTLITGTDSTTVAELTYTSAGEDIGIVYKGAAGAATAAAATPYYTTATAARIAPGNYNLVLKITTNTSKPKSYYWSDRIVVLPNQKTEQTVTVPYFIDTLPTAPEGLGSGYYGPLNDTDEYYDVQFNWTDKSNNEDYFQLELVDFTELSKDTGIFTTAFQTATVAKLKAAKGFWGADAAATTSDLDAAWEAFTYNSTTNPESKETVYVINKDVVKYVGTGYPHFESDADGLATATEISAGVSSTAVGQGETFYNNTAIWIDGSLNKNNDYVVLKLQLGHQYFARLCAVNDVGRSKYIYVQIDDTTGSIASVAYKRFDTTDVAAGDIKKFTKAKEINQFRYRYFATGGDFRALGADITNPATNAATENTIKVPESETNTDKLTYYKNENMYVGYGIHRAGSEATCVTILNPLYADTAAATPAKVRLLKLNSAGDAFFLWEDWKLNDVNGSSFFGTVGAAPALTAANPELTQSGGSTAITDIYAGNPAGADTAAQGYAAKLGDYKYIGYTGFDVYATYTETVNKGNAYVDEAMNYKIKPDWVAVYVQKEAATAGTMATASTVTEITTDGTTGVTKVGTSPDEHTTGIYKNGMYNFSILGASNAKRIFVCLLNDSSKVFIGNSAIGYDKITVKVFPRGEVQTASIPATETTSLTRTVTHATAANGAVSTASLAASYNYVPIDIIGYQAGTYEIIIEATANTTQSTYTYTTYMSLVDGYLD